MIIINQNHQTPLWNWRPEKPSHQLFGISSPGNHDEGNLTRDEYSSPYLQPQPCTQSFNKDDHTGLPKGSSEDQVANKHTVPSQSSFAFDDVAVTEDDDNFYYEADLPGVKTRDLAVELEDGVIDIRAQRAGKKQRLAQTYHRRFRIGDQDMTIDSTQLSANLSKGVLIISVPKKSKHTNENVEVLVENSEPPEGDPALNLEVDIPGVKAKNVRVVLTPNGELHVSGKRTRGTGKDLQQAYKVNSKRIDISKLDAYLADGVLYIQAPSKKSAKLNIPVTTGAHRVSGDDYVKAYSQFDDSPKSTNGPNGHFDASKCADHMSGTRANNMKPMDTFSTNGREDKKDKCTETGSPTTSKAEQDKQGKNENASNGANKNNKAKNKKKKTCREKSKLSFRRGFLL